MAQASDQRVYEIQEQLAILPYPNAGGRLNDELRILTGEIDSINRDINLVNEQVQSLSANSTSRYAQELAGKDRVINQLLTQRQEDEKRIRKLTDLIDYLRTHTVTPQD